MKVPNSNIFREGNFSIIALIDKELISRLYILEFYKSLKTIPSPNGNRIQIGIIIDEETQMTNKHRKICLVSIVIREIKTKTNGTLFYTC